MQDYIYDKISISEQRLVAEALQLKSKLKANDSFPVNAV